MLAEFRVIPVGGSQPFVRLIADLLPILAETNLQYQVHAMGTTVEGDLDAILELVRRCHAELRKHADRVLIELSLDDRQGAEGRDGAQPRAPARDQRQAAGAIPADGSELARSKAAHSSSRPRTTRRPANLPARSVTTVA